jgi:hypothetical protein
VIGSRCLLMVGIVAAALAPTAQGGIFGRKPKSDAAHAKQLVETLRSDADERKRKAAALDLRDFDPRTHQDVIPALVAALQKDPSPSVRSEAAESIGLFKAVFPVAGMALEKAAESDPIPSVRASAKQSLWEYHLNGYRSAKGADGIAGQTPEPPFARAASPRIVLPVPPPQLPTIPPPMKTTTSTAPPPLAPVVLLKQFRFVVGDTMWEIPAGANGGVQTLLTTNPPYSLNTTEEPPLAKPKGTIPARPTQTANLDLPAIPVPPPVGVPQIALPPLPR